MINVRYTVDIIDDPEDMNLVAELCGDDDRSIYLTSKGHTCHVSSDDMIVVVENDMANVKYIYGKDSRKGYCR